MVNHVDAVVDPLDTTLEIHNLDSFLTGEKRGFWDANRVLIYTLSQCAPMWVMKGSPAIAVI